MYLSIYLPTYLSMYLSIYTCMLFLLSKMIKNNIAKKLQALPTGHSDRIMSLRLPLQGDKSATLVSVYSPTLQADSAVKEAFYGDLHTVITRIDPKDKLIILGDFNARVGRDSQPWKGVLGKYGLQRQRPLAPTVLLTTPADHHKHTVSTARLLQNYLAPPSLKALASSGLRPSSPERRQRCRAFQSHAQGRLLHRPQTCTCEACIHFQATFQEEKSTNQETPGAPTLPTRDRSSLPGQAGGKAAAPTEP